MMTSSQTKTATPVPNENKANTDAPMSMSRMRLCVSDHCAMGTVSDSPRSAATATRDRTAALPMWNDRWMFGISKPKESRSISSTMLNPNRMARA
jgi:hypothetical protein